MELPRTIVASLGIGVEMPRSRAARITAFTPTCCVSRAAATLDETAKASRKLIGPRYCRSALCGAQPPIVTGSSATMLSGVIPARIAAR